MSKPCETPDPQPATRPIPVADNQLLKAMADRDAVVLRPLVEPVPLKAGEVLYEPGQALRHVHFVESGLVAIVGTNRNRRRMQVAMVGFEGMTGIETVLGIDLAAHEAVVQSAGAALRLPTDALRQATAGSPSLHGLLLRFAHAFMVQINQAAVAAGRAHITERLARSLLMSQDRLRADEWRVTHDFLALLMGVRRQGITEALHDLEGKGLIRSTRNRIRVIDRDALERAANGFYGAAEAEYRRLFAAEPKAGKAARVGTSAWDGKAQPAPAPAFVGGTLATGTDEDSNALPRMPKTGTPVVNLDSAGGRSSVRPRPLTVGGGASLQHSLCPEGDGPSTSSDGYRRIGKL